MGINAGGLALLIHRNHVHMTCMIYLWAHLSPGSGEPVAAARHSVSTGLLGLRLRNLVTALRLGGAVKQTMMNTFTARA